MTGDTYPLCTVWVAPCDRCGAGGLHYGAGSCTVTDAANTGGTN